MAFRKKAAFILKHKPDILIVPECEHPDKLLFKTGLPIPTDILWFGSNQHKGLGIFSYSQFRFTILETHNEEIKMVVPILVTGGKTNFTLFAIWANNPTDPDGQYVEQVWKALHHYDNQLSNKPIVLIGDFNSNTIWDRKYRPGNHSNVVKLLAEKGIHSAYHVRYKQQQGKEKHPTFYLYRHQDKAYHLDYCFLSADMLAKLKKVSVGRYNTWKQHSDHVPVIITLDELG